MLRTVNGYTCGSEFKKNGAKNWKTLLERSVSANGWISSRTADKCKVRLQTRNMILSCRYSNLE